MKKHINWGLAALSLLFVASSCTKETSESANDIKTGDVSFKTVLGKQSKASEFKYSTWVDNDQLTVLAYPVGGTTQANSFTLTLTKGVTADLDVWDYSPSFTQPGYALRYYSWYPTTNVSGGAAANTTYSFQYTVQGVATQEDLIAASTTSNGTTVTLPFSHLLSQVNFAVTNVFGVKIEITNLSVNTVKNSGTYTLATTSSWGTPTGSASYTYTPVVGTNITNEALATGSISYMGNGGSTYTRDNALMLMPQTFTTAADGTISFDYKLTTKDASNSDVVKTGQISADLCDFETTTWAPGKRYLYVIDFTSFLSGGPITFKVTVDEWTNDNDNTVAETLLVANGSAGSIEAAIAQHSASSASQTVFPIAVPEDISSNVTIANITGFKTGDQIRIEFLSAASVSYLLLHADIDADASGVWKKTSSGRVVTLTKQ